MRLILGLGLVAVLVATAFAGADDKKDVIDGKKLLGKWEPKDSPKGVKVVVEFAKEGKMNIEAEFEGNKESKTGTYKLDADKLTVTIEGEKAKTSTVLKLTDETLEIKNSSDKTTTFSRVKAK